MDYDTAPDPQQPETECALYRHFNADGELLYVGISISAVRRLGEHQNSAWARQISRVTVEWLPSRAEAERLERQAIRAERPKFNIAGTVIVQGGHIFGNGSSMTPSDFKQARQSLGLTQTQTAALFGRTLRQVQNWEAKAVDAMAARLMRAYVAGYRPDDWPT